MATTITDEQFAARELVRDWAAGSGATAAVRDIEQGEPKAWQPVFARLAELATNRQMSGGDEDAHARRKTILAGLGVAAMLGDQPAG